MLTSNSSYRNWKIKVRGISLVVYWCSTHESKTLFFQELQSEGEPVINCGVFMGFYHDRG